MLSPNSVETVEVPLVSVLHEQQARDQLTQNNLQVESRKSTAT
jgi:beta-lactam-binding protein with PASTA domain